MYTQLYWYVCKQVNYRSKTALEAAAAKGFTEVVQILLQGKLKAYNDARHKYLRCT